MTIKSSDDVFEDTFRKCERLLYAGLVHGKKLEPDNSWGQAHEQAKYLAALPLIEALPLLALLNASRITPAASCRATRSEKAGETSRSAIGGASNSESRPTNLEQ